MEKKKFYVVIFFFLCSLPLSILSPTLSLYGGHVGNGLLQCPSCAEPALGHWSQAVAFLALAVRMDLLADSQGINRDATLNPRWQQTVTLRPSLVIWLPLEAKTKCWKLFSLASQSCCIHLGYSVTPVCGYTTDERLTAIKTALEKCAQAWDFESTQTFKYSGCYDYIEKPGFFRKELGKKMK